MTCMVTDVLYMPGSRTRPYRALGERIAILRERADLTQRELAARVGKSEGYFARIESGESRPRIPVLRRIATEINTSYEKLAVLAEYLSAAEAARWEAPPDRVDLFREMSDPKVPRSVVEEAWQLARAKWQMILGDSREDLDATRRRLSGTEEEGTEGAK
jgi:transcriptional regulator with XRE-family HTH domain